MKKEKRTIWKTFFFAFVFFLKIWKRIGMLKWNFLSKYFIPLSIKRWREGKFLRYSLSKHRTLFWRKSDLQDVELTSKLTSYSLVIILTWTRCSWWWVGTRSNKGVEGGITDQEILIQWADLVSQDIGNRWTVTTASHVTSKTTGSGESQWIGL